MYRWGWCVIHRCSARTCIPKHERLIADCLGHQAHSACTKPSHDRMSMWRSNRSSTRILVSVLLFGVIIRGALCAASRTSDDQGLCETSQYAGPGSPYCHIQVRTSLAPQSFWYPTSGWCVSVEYLHV